MKKVDQKELLAWLLYYEGGRPRDQWECLTEQIAAEMAVYGKSETWNKLIKD